VLDIGLHFNDAIICLIFSALVGGTVHKIGQRLFKKVIKSCRRRVNFGGYIFTNVGKVNI